MKKASSILSEVNDLQFEALRNIKKILEKKPLGDQVVDFVGGFELVDGNNLRSVQMENGQVTAWVDSADESQLASRLNVLDVIAILENLEE